jgi:hypothetical protein
LEQVAQAVMADFPSNLVVPIEAQAAVAVLEDILKFHTFSLMVVMAVAVET